MLHVTDYVYDNIFYDVNDNRLFNSRYNAVKIQSYSFKSWYMSRQIYQDKWILNCVRQLSNWHKVRSTDNISKGILNCDLLFTGLIFGFFFNYVWRKYKTNTHFLLLIVMISSSRVQESRNLKAKFTFLSRIIH